MLEGFAASFSRAISDGFRSFGTQRLLANTDENDSVRVLAHGEQEVSCSGLPLPLIALKASVTQSFWVYGEMWGWREKRGPLVPGSCPGSSRSPRSRLQLAKPGI